MAQKKPRLTIRVIRGLSKAVEMYKAAYDSGGDGWGGAPQNAQEREDWDKALEWSRWQLENNAWTKKLADRKAAKEKQDAQQDDRSSGADSGSGQVAREVGHAV